MKVFILLHLLPSFPRKVLILSVDPTLCVVNCEHVVVANKGLQNICDIVINCVLEVML
jgi:hypothetical protein